MPVVGTLTVLGACDRPTGNEILHPISEHIALESMTASIIANDTVPRGWPPLVAARWEHAKAAILGAETVLHLGTDADDYETFGVITDVAVGSGGQVFVLDDHAQEIRIFDPSGRFLEKVGGFGDGPMEFRSANGIELLDDRSLVVSTFGSLVKHLTRSHAGWQLQETIRLPEMGSRGLCSTANKRIVVTGYRRDGNTLVHELSIPGGGLRSLAPGYQAEHWLVQMTMGEGTIGCLSGPDRVVFSYANQAIVRSFDLDTGKELWVSRITDFASRPIYEGVNSTQDRYVRRSRAAEWDVVGAVHALLLQTLLIQVANFEPTTETVTVRSYLVDAESGVGASLGDRLPPIVPVPHGYAALFVDPYPRLELKRFVRANEIGNGS